MVITPSGQIGLCATKLVERESWRDGAHAQTQLLSLAAEIAPCSVLILNENHVKWRIIVLVSNYSTSVSLVAGDHSYFSRRSENRGSKLNVWLYCCTLEVVVQDRVSVVMYLIHDRKSDAFLLYFRLISLTWGGVLSWKRHAEILSSYDILV